MRNQKTQTTGRNPKASDKNIVFKPYYNCSLLWENEEDFWITFFIWVFFSLFLP